MGSRSPRTLRFNAVTVDRVPGTRCKAQVELSRRSGEKFVGMAEGPWSLLDELRWVASATVHAVRQALPTQGHRVALQDVAAVRVFGSLAVLVTLSVRNDSGPRAVVGFCLTDEEPRRAAALAVLNGVNRVLDVG